MKFRLPFGIGARWNGRPDCEPLVVPDPADFTLVAIAKDERRYLAEWVAHHLAIGVPRFILFDNDSTDGTGAYLRDIAAQVPGLQVIDWPSVEGASPQRSAYNHAMTLVGTEWVGFIDIDEFLVPWRDGSLRAYLDRAGDDVSAIHVNWRGFGSNGREAPDYPLVTRHFTRAAVQGWDNNRHYKTLARAKRLGEVFIHHAVVTEGRRVQSDFSDLAAKRVGASRHVIHDGIQLNHYQCKTYPEFRARMQRGQANFPAGHPDKDGLDASRTRFDALDRNEEEDTRILQFHDGMLRMLARIAPDDGWPKLIRAADRAPLPACFEAPPRGKPPGSA
ncbi:hypothetical protein ASG52_10585 [Methylobacterium sp. Leaf456]|uniref:glycosyltransferase family 2 protein n=1 Tax=Methylobacterium sp. Leaf456 TaxID=1736382 RepID=UPI0006F9BFDF|nr:glycosyltransferase family 2 protein [Methylobacterium sp. Leaf456]KQT47712.1 hypothetical protein ASG52_10585 [Methylobacterium sp. Leaf456]